MPWKPNEASKTLPAKDMIPERWYWTERTGRFIAGRPLSSKPNLIVIYLDGDQDMQSMDTLAGREIVTEADPK